ncbi:MAG: hypothetical protein IT429_01605 [Gemmataceae bacterium]|nr:hypothetical protein [Gemmataceae bacterium]
MDGQDRSEHPTRDGQAERPPQIRRQGPTTRAYREVVIRNGVFVRRKRRPVRRAAAG